MKSDDLPYWWENMRRSWKMRQTKRNGEWRNTIMLEMMSKWWKMIRWKTAEIKELMRNTERLKTFCRIYLTFCGMDFNTTESMLIYLRSKRIVILVHLNLCIWSKTCLEYLLTFYWFTSVCIIAIMSLQLVKPNVSSQFVQFGILCELRLLSHCM